MARRLAGTRKKWLLAAHIMLSGAWLGAALCSLVLNILAGRTVDGNLLLGAYLSADILDGFLIRPLAIGTAATGILLAVLGQWGLFRFQWIIAKLTLTVLVIASGVIVYGLFRVSRSILSIISAAGLQALQDPSFRSSQTLLLIFVVAEVVCLSASVALSVSRPSRQRRQINESTFRASSGRSAAVCNDFTQRG